MFTKYQTHSTTIRGVTYITVSRYEQKEKIFDRIGNLILHDFQSSKEDDVTNESCLRPFGVSTKNNTSYAVPFFRLVSLIDAILVASLKFF